MNHPHNTNDSSFYAEYAAVFAIEKMAVSRSPDETLGYQWASLRKSS
jgi:hypothetical protein